MGIDQPMQDPNVDRFRATSVYQLYHKGSDEDSPCVCGPYPPSSRSHNAEQLTDFLSLSLPFGVPHRVNQDDWYEGMLIPKDSTVILPTWGIHLSESMGYEKPEQYNPDRFLGFPKLADSYAGSPDYAKRDHYGYGAGRRICPGIHLAERQVLPLPTMAVLDLSH